MAKIFVWNTTQKESLNVKAGGSNKTSLSLNNPTFSIGRVGVKGNSDNVTKYDVFFLRSSLIRRTEMQWNAKMKAFQNPSQSLHRNHFYLFVTT